MELIFCKFFVNILYLITIIILIFGKFIQYFRWKTKKSRQLDSRILPHFPSFHYNSRLYIVL